MPFMKGPAPIRRTIQYLQKGKLVFRECVQILTINYIANADHHKDIRNFIFWDVPQIQYKNPDVQVLTFRNLTPTPLLKCYLDDGQQVLFDVFGKSREQILEQLIRTVGKSKELLMAEAIAKEDNPSNFGPGCRHHCLCEIQGQIPCPDLIQMPKEMRGKHKRNPPED